jgi:putative cytochrome c4
MANPSSDRNETIIRSILFIAVVLLAVGIIIFLKRSSDVPLTPEGFAARDSAQRMATPDTTVAPTEDFSSSDTNTAQPTDTVSMDLRLPSDAGYEDGYFAGLQDGLDDMERASYDDTSKFPTEAQRRNYADAYKRGYAQGFADGQNQGEEDANDNEESERTPAPLAPKPNAPTSAKPNVTPAKPNTSTTKSNAAGSNASHANPAHGSRSTTAPRTGTSTTK